jgi:hypothetical protein
MGRSYFLNAYIEAIEGGGGVNDMIVDKKYWKIIMFTRDGVWKWLSNSHKWFQQVIFLLKS